MGPFVQFENQQSPDDLVVRAPKPATLGDALLKAKFVKNPGEAMILIAVAASLLISASFYLLASSVPAEPRNADFSVENDTTRVSP